MKKIFFVYILVLIVLVGLFLLQHWPDFHQYPRPIFGISFSRLKAEELGLDWREAYLKILDDLKVKKIRLAVYWHDLEPSPKRYFFDDLDWQLKEAEKRGVKLILAIGQRVPGWPECHFPDWARNLNQLERERNVLVLLKKIVERYKNQSIIEAWQVENEPLFKGFGLCPQPNKIFLEQEVKLVRTIDPYRPIIVSDSGELSDWLGVAKQADILGITIYRTVWSQYLKRYFNYFLPPAFYQLKAFLVKKIGGVEKVIVVEFQAEPWSPKGPLIGIPLEEQFKSMSFDRWQENLIYAQRTGFSEIYLWGAEWWLWLKEKMADGRFWQAAKNLFNQ